VPLWAELQAGSMAEQRPADALARVGLQMTARWAFKGERGSDLSFEKGDVIVVTRVGKAWWDGYIKGKPDMVGSFPRNRVEVLSVNVARSSGTSGKGSKGLPGSPRDPASEHDPDFSPPLVVGSGDGGFDRAKAVRSARDLTVSVSQRQLPAKVPVPHRNGSPKPSGEDPRLSRRQSEPRLNPRLSTGEQQPPRGSDGRVSPPAGILSSQGVIQPRPRPEEVPVQPPVVEGGWSQFLQIGPDTSDDEDGNLSVDDDDLSVSDHDSPPVDRVFRSHSTADVLHHNSGFPDITDGVATGDAIVNRGRSKTQQLPPKEADPGQTSSSGTNGAELVDSRIAPPSPVTGGGGYMFAVPNRGMGAATPAGPRHRVRREMSSGVVQVGGLKEHMVEVTVTRAERAVSQNNRPIRGGVSQLLRQIREAQRLTLYKRATSPLARMLGQWSRSLTDPQPTELDSLVSKVTSIVSELLEADSVLGPSGDEEHLRRLSAGSQETIEHTPKGARTVAMHTWYTVRVVTNKGRERVAIKRYRELCEARRALKRLFPGVKLLPAGGLLAPHLLKDKRSSRTVELRRAAAEAFLRGTLQGARGMSDLVMVFLFPQDTRAKLTLTAPPSSVSSDIGTTTVIPGTIEPSLEVSNVTSSSSSKQQQQQQQSPQASTAPAGSSVIPASLVVSSVGSGEGQDPPAPPPWEPPVVVVDTTLRPPTSLASLGLHAALAAATSLSTGEEEATTEPTEDTDSDAGSDVIGYPGGPMKPGQCQLGRVVVIDDLDAFDQLTERAFTLLHLEPLSSTQARRLQAPPGGWKDEHRAPSPHEVEGRLMPLPGETLRVAYTMSVWDGQSLAAADVQRVQRALIMLPFPEQASEVSTVRPVSVVSLPGDPAPAEDPQSAQRAIPVYRPLPIPLGLYPALAFVPYGHGARVLLAPEAAFGQESIPPLIPADAYLVVDISVAPPSTELVRDRKTQGTLSINASDLVRSRQSSSVGLKPPSASPMATASTPQAASTDLAEQGYMLSRRNTSRSEGDVLPPAQIMHMALGAPPPQSEPKPQEVLPWMSAGSVQEVSDTNAFTAPTWAELGEALQGEVESQRPRAASTKATTAVAPILPSRAPLQTQLSMTEAAEAVGLVQRFESWEHALSWNASESPDRERATPLSEARTMGMTGTPLSQQFPLPPQRRVAEAPLISPAPPPRPGRGVVTVTSTPVTGSPDAQQATSGSAAALLRELLSRERERLKQPIPEEHNRPRGRSQSVTQLPSSRRLLDPSSGSEESGESEVLRSASKPARQLASGRESSVGFRRVLHLFDGKRRRRVSGQTGEDSRKALTSASAASEDTV
jgi:hypothetical protein